jgi:hypothetical protein
MIIGFLRSKLLREVFFSSGFGKMGGNLISVLRFCGRKYSLKVALSTRNWYEHFLYLAYQPFSTADGDENEK